MKLLSIPSTSFKPMSYDAESVSMDKEGSEFTGKKLQAVRYSVNTQKEMLIQVCGHVLLEYRPTIEQLCANEKHGFSNKSESWRREVGQDMYIWSDNSNNMKLSILHGLFNECDILQTELAFELRQNTEYDESEKQKSLGAYNQSLLITIILNEGRITNMRMSEYGS